MFWFSVDGPVLVVTIPPVPATSAAPPAVDVLLLLLLLLLCDEESNESDEPGTAAARDVKATGQMDGSSAARLPLFPPSSI